MLLPIVFNLQSNEIEKNQKIIDRLFSRSQVEGREKSLTSNDIGVDSINYMRYDFAEFINVEISIGKFLYFISKIDLVGASPKDNTTFGLIISSCLNKYFLQFSLHLFKYFLSFG